MNAASIKGTTKALLIGAAIALPGAALADGGSLTSDIAELRARVAELEANAGRNADLNFEVGAATQLTIYGFVRAEAFYDFDFDQGDLSVTGALGDGAPETDGAFNTSVRVSRLGFLSSTDTDIGTIGGQLEFDLFGSAGTAELRVRHANITIGGLLIGQFWTNFMPIGQYPTTADFNGPVGITFARVPQIRYTGTAGDLTYSVSIEESNGNSEDPTFTAAGLYSTELLDLRLAGYVGTQIEAGNEDDVFGVTLSAALRPWAGGALTGNFTTGEGLGHLLIGGGNDLDAAGNAVDVDALTLEYRQDVSDSVNVGIAYGFEDYDITDIDADQRLQSVHVNAFWNPTDRLRLGVEYIYGEREDGDGDEFDANRIGASATFTF